MEDIKFFTVELDRNGKAVKVDVCIRANDVMSVAYQAAQNKSGKSRQGAVIAQVRKGRK